jgi:pimeloyl-ACP methyl ester carboxylesterase
MMRQVRVNDVDLSYVEQGTGPPVVFVHGAFSDLRYWEPQRQAIAIHYRFIAYTARYHGTAPWSDAGQQYAWATHVADLVAFIRWLNAGPVHLVGLSAGGRTATLVAVQYPDLVRSLTLAEPGLHELLVDLPETQPVYDERTKALEPIGTAIQAGEVVQATKLFFEMVNNQGPGAFDRQPEALRQMILDNARTLPLTRSTPPLPAVTRAMLGGVKTPTLVVGGAHTRRYFSLINAVVVQGIPGSRLVVIPQATHLMSYQNPAAFNEALLHFLAHQ